MLAMREAISFDFWFDFFPFLRSAETRVRMEVVFVFVASGRIS